MIPFLKRGRVRERERESVRCSSSSLKRSRSFSSEEKYVVVLSKMLYYLGIVSMYRNSISLLLSSMCYIVVIVSVLLFNGHLGERRGGIHGFGHRFSVWSLALRDAFFTAAFPSERLQAHI